MRLCVPLAATLPSTTATTQPYKRNGRATRPRRVNWWSQVVVFVNVRPLELNGTWRLADGGRPRPPRTFVSAPSGFCRRAAPVAKRNTRGRRSGTKRQGRNRTTEFVIDGLRLYNKVNAGSRAHEHISVRRIGNGTCVAVHVALNFVTRAGCPGRLSGECLCDALLATR